MKLIRVRWLMTFGLLPSMAACGAPRGYPPWVPGTYHYRSTLPGTGAVDGTIEIGPIGPVGMTSNLGACDSFLPEMYIREALERYGQLLSRGFTCGTEHRVSVVLGRDGDPPIEGTVSNQRTVTETTYGETTCREYQTVEAGERTERICIAWNWGPKTERRTTGASARWHLVSDTVATPP